MRALVLQHVATEPCGLIGASLARRAIAIDVVETHLRAPVPATIGAHDALVVMGGPMGVYEAERHPHLRDELRLIEDALRRDVPILGVCLGSQLLAHALGARVAPSGGREIGWHAVQTSAAARDDRLFSRAPSTFTPWHWHGDVFDVPASATPLASSASTACQAFRQGNSWGILFHLEATRAIVDGMTDGFADEARAHGVDLGLLAREAEASLAALSPIAAGVFDAFAEIVSDRAPSSPSRARASDGVAR